MIGPCRNGPVGSRVYQKRDQASRVRVLRHCLPLSPRLTWMSVLRACRVCEEQFDLHRALPLANTVTLASRFALYGMYMDKSRLGGSSRPALAPRAQRPRRWTAEQQNPLGIEFGRNECHRRCCYLQGRLVRPSVRLLGFGWDTACIAGRISLQGPKN